MRPDRQAEVRARDELRGTDTGEVYFRTGKEAVITPRTGKVAWVYLGESALTSLGGEKRPAIADAIRPAHQLFNGLTVSS